METHVKVLGWLNIVMGVLGLLVAIFVFVVLVGTGYLAVDENAFPVLMTVGILCAGFTALLSIPGVIAGIGLLGYRPWARILALVLGVLNLFSVPIGTIVGVYTLYVLLDDDSSRLFNRV